MNERSDDGWHASCKVDEQNARNLNTGRVNDDFTISHCTWDVDYFLLILHDDDDNIDLISLRKSLFVGRLSWSSGNGRRLAVSKQKPKSSRISELSIGIFLKALNSVNYHRCVYRDFTFRQTNIFIRQILFASCVHIRSKCSAKKARASKHKLCCECLYKSHEAVRVFVKEISYSDQSTASSFSFLLHTNFFFSSFFLHIHFSLSSTKKKVVARCFSFFLSNWHFETFTKSLNRCKSFF